MHPLFIGISIIADGLWPEAEELMVDSIWQEMNKWSGFGDSHKLLRLYPARYSLNRFRYSHAARRMLKSSSLLGRNEREPERSLPWKLFKTVGQQGRSE
jgi:hypothetical protein